MLKQCLGGMWQLEIPGYAPCAGKALPVTVPGSVYSGLLENSKMEDPFWRDNELDALAIMEHDFIFSRSFELNPSMQGCERYILVCEGLDTICDVELNGHMLGHAENMHRTWEFDIKPKTKNELKLTFRSPTRAIAERYNALFTDGSGDAMRGFTQLRKAHCMFGWDWGPRLPDAGIWRNIYIVGVSSGERHIDGVYITQIHEKDSATLSFDVTFKNNFEFSILNFQLKVTVTSPDGESWSSDGEPITIKSPQIWWPNGYGAQPLYTVRVEAGGDVWERRIGLRTVTVNREKDEWGESFAIAVNGLPIFAMGGNYIPQDNILSRVTRESIYALISDCAAANYNCIRVWGGGYYPEDAFFDACDEMGIIVWQDFMFACGIYELTADFEKNIRAEMVDNIKRIRHHASLGLWCGNNELESQYNPPNCFRHSPKQHGDYTRIFGYIIPKTLEEHDPNAFYWPSSPSSGGDFDDPDDENRGDVHCWGVWHGMWPFSAYREHYYRFVSEFGFQSFPDIKTIRAFTEEDDRNIFSRVMEMHQRNVSANGKIAAYLANTYLYPHSFEMLLFASQLLQADAMRYGVEHWRRNRGRCMGAIYWQVNDIWPVASWASIDYFGHWKALHYFAKRFFAPVMLSCKETGEMSERPSPVSQRGPIRKAAQFALANETKDTVSGKVLWALRGSDAGVLKSGEMSICAQAFSSAWTQELDFSDGTASACDELSNYISFEFVPDEGHTAAENAKHSPTVSHCETVGSAQPGLCEIGCETRGLSPCFTALRGTALFCMPKHFKFMDPMLVVTRTDNEVTVTSSAYAKSVELYSDADDFVLSDNFFDMNAGSVTVRILRGDPSEIKARSVYDIR